MNSLEIKISDKIVIYPDRFLIVVTVRGSQKQITFDPRTDHWIRKTGYFDEFEIKLIKECFDKYKNMLIFG